MQLDGIPPPITSRDASYINIATIGQRKFLNSLKIFQRESNILRAEAPKAMRPGLVQRTNKNGALIPVKRGFKIKHNYSLRVMRDKGGTLRAARELVNPEVYPHDYTHGG